MLALLLAFAQSAVTTPAELDALHERRRSAAAALTAAATEASATDDSTARLILARAAESAADLLPGQDVAATLRASARLGLAVADPRGGLTLLRRACSQAADRLAFAPVEEAPLPEGYPAFTPVGEVLLLDYPACRLARTSMRSSNGAFWRLFQHIQSSDIAMTAPVQTDYGPPQSDGASRPETMAFLYDRKERGPAGEQGAVAVLDQAPLTVISLGARGFADPDSVEYAEFLLRARLDAPGSEWIAAGPLRVLEYNSPMVGGPRRFYEVQIPVAPAVSPRADSSDAAD